GPRPPVPRRPPAGPAQRAGRRRWRRPVAPGTDRTRGNPCLSPPLAIRPYDTASGPGALALPRRQAMSDESPVLTAVDDRGVVTVTLNRPEVNNAYNGPMIDWLLAAL